MSGLKINYQKSEVFGVGLDPDQIRRVANSFNCNVGKFPMTYLGLPISMDRILAKDLAFAPQKVDKKLGSGFNALASSVLINSCLDSIANYAMGFYLFDEGNHHKMGMSRARFFWEGVGEKRKYHMVKWEVLCKPKEFGGMGFSDTRIRNICLLSKWIFRLENDSQDLSCQILRKKYMGDKGFFMSDCKGSQFWISLHKIK
jgi:hypothetical protein